MPVAETTLEQKMSALQKGDAKRRARSRLRKKVVTGEVDIRDVIADPPHCIDTTLVSDTLLWAPRFGKERLITLNKRAVADGINLVSDWRRTSMHTRDWLLRNILPGSSRRTTTGVMPLAAWSPARFTPDMREQAVLRQRVEETGRTNLVPVTPFARRFLELLASGDSAEDIARRAGMGEAAGSKVRGKLTQTNLTVPVAERLCEAMHMDPWECGL